MTAPNKRRGYEAEVAVVGLAIEHGFADAHRTWASDGRAEGLSSKVDIVAGGEYLQSKRIKEPPKYLADMIDLMRKKVVHAATFYFDRKGSWCFIPTARYFQLRRAEETLRSMEKENGRT